MQRAIMVLQIITDDDDDSKIQQCNGVEGPKDSNDAASILKRKLFNYKPCNLADRLCIQIVQMYRCRRRIRQGRVG